MDSIIITNWSMVYLVMPKVVVVIAKYPLEGHHCNPYDEAIEKNAIVPDVNFLISLDVSI